MPVRSTASTRTRQLLPLTFAFAAAGLVLSPFGCSSDAIAPEDASSVVDGAVRGRDDASESDATADASSGWRIQLDATGLPRLEGDRFYEAWLRSPKGELVPVGTFNEGQDVTLWAGVSPLSYKVLTVTRERADGNEASSGQKVLVGPVRTG